MRVLLLLMLFVASIVLISASEESQEHYDRSAFINATFAEGAADSPLMMWGHPMKAGLVTFNSSITGDTVGALIAAIMDPSFNDTLASNSSLVLPSKRDPSIPSTLIIFAVDGLVSESIMHEGHLHSLEVILQGYYKNGGAFYVPYTYGSAISSEVVLVYLDDKYDTRYVDTNSLTDDALVEELNSRTNVTVLEVDYENSNAILNITASTLSDCEDCIFLLVTALGESQEASNLTSSSESDFDDVSVVSRRRDISTPEEKTTFRDISTPEETTFKYTFFTTPIIMGLLVSLIVFAILMIGIMSLLSLQGPTRFEDPRGKIIQLGPL